MNKAFSLLGMACRAGRISLGHDMCLEAVAAGKAKLVIFCSDASQGLKKEICAKCAGLCDITELEENKFLLSQYLPKSVAVLSVNDTGFADRFLQLYKEVK